MSKAMVKVPVYAVIEGGGLSEAELVNLYINNRREIEEILRKKLSDIHVEGNGREGNSTIGFLVGIENVKRRFPKT